MFIVEKFPQKTNLVKMAERPPQERISLFSLGEDLRLLGLDSTHIEEIEKITENLKHTLALGLATPSQKSEYIASEVEGRGFYITVHVENTEVIVYVKGSGSTATLSKETEPAKYAGFGLGLDAKQKVRFDEERVRGAAKFKSIVDEYSQGLFTFFVTAGHLLIDNPDEFSFKTILDKGTILPFGGSISPGLTSELYARLVSEKDASLVDAFGSIGEIVPSDQRYLDSSSPATWQDLEKLQQLSKPEMLRQLMSNFKQLLTAGVIFSSDPAHLQNIYYKPGALTIFGDAESHLLLDAVPDIVTLTAKKTGQEIELTKRQAQVLIIADFLRCFRFFPRAKADYGQYWTKEDREDAFHYFITDLLPSERNPDQYVEALQSLDPDSWKLLLKLGDKIVTEYESSEWSKPVVFKRKIYQKYGLEESVTLSSNEVQHSVRVSFDMYGVTP